MEKIVFAPLPHLAEELRAAIEREEERLFRIDESTPSEPSIDWKDTPEGRVHNTLLFNYAAVDPQVSVRKLNHMFTLCARKGSDPRGRPPTWKRGRYYPKYRRAMRVYVINKLLAAQLKLDPGPPPQLADICPDLVPEAEHKPIEAFEMLQRFEKWTEYKLPHQAWVIFTREDRQCIAKSVEPSGWKEEGVPTLKLADYVALRSAPGGMDLINRILSAERVKSKQEERELEEA